jgi:hypothetical protein
MHEQQYQVIKHVSQALARQLEASFRDEGKKTRIAFEYAPELKKNGAVTILHYGFSTPAIDHVEREYERVQGGEQFRNPPLKLRAHFIVSCWAPAPDDQELMGLALRTLHDRNILETEGEEDETVAYEGRPPLEMHILSLDEHKKIAEAFGMPMAPSMAYWVDVTVQSALATPIKRVKERVIDFKKIDG